MKVKQMQNENNENNEGESVDELDPNIMQMILDRNKQIVLTLETMSTLKDIRTEIYVLKRYTKQLESIVEHHDRMRIN